MIAVLLPVKQFSRSKERLAAWLTPAEREQLARTMFDDVWTTLQQSTGFDRLLVATAEPYVIARCQAADVACLEETAQQSHSDSVHRATEWAIGQGARTLVSVPIDTPSVTSEEIFQLIELGRQHAVVIAASADGTGTNALVRTPPAAIAPHFGPNSCRIHTEEASSRGLSHFVLHMPGFEADVDTPEDAEAFLALGRPCRTEQLLREFFAARKPAGVLA